MMPKGAIAAGLEQLGLDQNHDLAGRLEGFVADLIKWNKVYNLTAIRDPQQILVQHIFDSLSVHSYIKGDTIIDVGTGGGFPGIPLAMVMPDKQFTLLDSNGKKTRFLQQMVINHQLQNCVVVQSRAESYAGEFDLVICRAFASLAEIVGYAGHLLSEGGSLLAMKGQPADELAGVPDSHLVTAIEKLEVPGLDAERHLVILKTRPPGAGNEQ